MAASPATPPRGFGVSLAAFDFAIAAAGGRAAIADKTTAWTKEHVVLPATRATSSSYADVLFAAGGAAFVGEATAFLSHAYAYPFLAVVDAVRAWEVATGASTFYYFDLFVVNQHGQTMGVRPELLWAEFCGNVERIGRTLLVCMWRSPVLPFTRVCCLAEIATALGQPAGSLELIMPLEEELAFRSSLAHSFDDLVRKACSVDLAAAKAYHCDHCLVVDAATGSEVCRHVLSTDSDHIDECPNDCAFVRAAIRDGIGFDVANERIAAAVRRWMAEAGRTALAALPEDERSTSDLASGYARLLSDQGRLDEAAALFREVLDGRRCSLGLAHPRTLAAAYDLGYLLCYQSQEGAAEKLLRGALEGQTAALGPEHVATLRTAFALARCLHDQRRFDEADALFVAVVAGRRAALGPDDPETLEALKHRGVLLEKWGKFGEAGECLRDALAGQRRTVGEFHPQTFSTLHKYATLLAAEGRTAEAAPLYHAAHAGRRRVLGDAHPHTLWSVSKIAGLLVAERRFAEALPLLREALAGFQRVFGAAHPATVAADQSLEAALAAFQ